MPLFEAVRLAFESIYSQKLKSFFSAVGVLIGVTFLIAVVSIVQGMNVYVQDSVTGAIGGVNTFQLRRNSNFNIGGVRDAQWIAWQRRPQISLDDAEYVKEHLTIPARIARLRNASASIAWHGRTAAGVRVTMADADIFRIKNWDIAEGRAFSSSEVTMGAAVAVIGSDIATQLFDGHDPIGEMLNIGGQPHRVIGVVAAQGTMFGQSQDNFVLTPLTAPASRLSNRPSLIREVSIQVLDPKQMPEAMDEVEVLMRIRRGLRPAEENNFHLQTAEGALTAWASISRVLFLALPGLVAISLVVGGIVIMNIMLVAVAERTREIGVRKALGAKRRDIMAQFVVESATLSVVGACLGIVAGLLLAFAVRAWSPLPAAVAPWSIGLGVGLGIFVGMTAGIYPAMMASKLDPIAALRQE